ncbi:MAG: hypothetical protein C0606_12320 [Hyphomicrobiales bacterium]|nr:MAG: hypothetical protein C0606_12320 [Hyphomicrobiales bacterium]
MKYGFLLAGFGIAAAAMSLGVTPAAAANACPPKKLSEILAPAKKGSMAIAINCDVKLDPKAVVTKRLVFNGPASSGVTFDCNGATIDGTKAGKQDTIIIQSKRTGKKPGAATWERPENNTIKNCTVKGSIRVIGMGVNGEDEFVKASSHAKGHTERAQAAAPTGIRVHNSTIEAFKRTAIYLAPGVTRFTLTHSKILGRSNGHAIYLDAETAHNTFRNNRIAVKTEYRETVAIDGSADNVFAGNSFSALENGGIYIYRNCGEGGTVRHQEPRRNRIINNSFYYDKSIGHNLSVKNWLTGSFNATGKVPAIWLASRNGVQPWCGADSKFGFGTGVNDKDMARDNVVAHNQIVKLDAGYMIEVDEKPNEVFGNRSVKAPERGKSGCYVSGALPRPYLADGQSAAKFQRKGKAVCTGMQVICDDGELVTKKVACR